MKVTLNSSSPVKQNSFSLQFFSPPMRPTMQDVVRFSADKKPLTKGFEAPESLGKALDKLLNPITSKLPFGTVYAPSPLPGFVRLKWAPRKTVRQDYTKQISDRVWGDLVSEINNRAAILSSNDSEQSKMSIVFSDGKGFAPWLKQDILLSLEITYHFKPNIYDRFPGGMVKFSMVDPSAYPKFSKSEKAKIEPFLTKLHDALRQWVGQNGPLAWKGYTTDNELRLEDGKIVAEIKQCPDRGAGERMTPIS